jgi:hypothetical protein
MPGAAPYLWPDLDARTRPGLGRPRLGHHGAMTEFDRLARRVYVGARDGVLDPEAAFDLACFLMDGGRPSEAVRQLAEQSVAGTDPAMLADLAGQVLEEVRFEPDFEVEPRLLEVFRRALEAVRADMRATGLDDPDRVHLGLDDNYLRHNFAHFRGYFRFTRDIAPGEGPDQVTALVAVADDVQDGVMGVLNMAWPVCPGHHFGGHAREHDGRAVWWCKGGGGHVIALIGHWGR